MPSQNDMILDHLKYIGGITSLEAYNEYGCTRLSARISDLRAMGIDIVAERVTKKNRFGEKVSVNQYRLKEAKTDE